MAYTIVLTGNARRDIQHAIDWENSRSPGLGRRLFREIAKTLNVLQNQPQSGTYRYEDVRCRATSAFPYLLHYVISEPDKQVIVLRVLHTGRKPTWES